MNPLPQTVPISHLRQRQDEILAMTEVGPVLLLSRSEPAAVLLSPSEWDALAAQLDELQGFKQAEHDRQLAERIANDYIAQSEQSATSAEVVSQNIFEAIQSDRQRQHQASSTAVASSEMRKRMKAVGVDADAHFSATSAEKA